METLCEQSGGSFQPAVAGEVPSDPQCKPMTNSKTDRVEGYCCRQSDTVTTSLSSGILTQVQGPGANTDRVSEAAAKVLMGIR